MAEAWRYTSEWQHLANTADEKKGSIHDDDAARNLGFRKAFVPGSVVANFAMPAILKRFGSGWLESGWYDFNFVSPVYVDEDVRTLAYKSAYESAHESSADGSVKDDAYEGADDDSGEIACRVETRDGRLCTHGTAGMGDTLPWHTEGALAEVFPEAVIGTQFEKEVTVAREDAEPMLRASHDHSRHWRDHVPPEQFMPIALHMIDFKRIPLNEAQQPGMWAQHAIVVRALILWNTPYRVRESLAEKGISGRTQYLTFQFHVYDKDDKEIAVGRHKCKFLNTER